MQTTTRNGLKKSESTDTYLATRSGNNDNFDVIDAAIAKCNWAGGALDPTADDDEADGYSAGSMWITDTAIWICVDASEGDAIWEQLWPDKLATSYLKADGSRELSASWDAGSHQIRAETFQSDVATGTAPLTVASSTKVTNLNADLLDGAELSTDTVADPGVDTKIPTEQAVREALTALVADGWIAAGETWTYASADSPTFTFTISGDKTSKYGAGMRLKLTQSSTTKYFIITKVEYSSPNTTVTVYGGTDYVLADSAISSPYYSHHKAPAGFPLSPEKWTVSLRNSSDYSQTNPTGGTWYNVGGENHQLSLPIGAWIVSYACCAVLTSGTADIYSTLSTSSNSETNPLTTQKIYVSGVASYNFVGCAHDYFVVSAKTTLYLLVKTSYTISGDGSVGVFGSSSTTVIKAVCAYL